ncbi:fam-a protein [Plasmodium vinckei vinckei]|uniref:Fam-a protein n=1 Tax=Plasmodium vinckei vinckei TaxID=54757 RepID=A0A449BY12_PLAVN|nr:fam-a protein [Plasmodium vinckei vinckei]VEV58356.1 fam-a protein [Plasmodium vinckei vinckei]
MNKGYIKITLALLSIVGCMQNIAFASETAATTNSLNKEYNQQLYIDPKEAKQAATVMAEALSYADIVNKLWDANSAKNFDDELIRVRVSQTYNPNLQIIRRQYKSSIMGLQRYCYSLVNKVELSKDETAILLVSSDMNDRSDLGYTNYINPIVESANSLKPNINSQKYIRTGGLSKMYANLAAIFIKKEEECVKVTVLGSIDPNTPSYVSKDAIKNDLVKKFINMIKLREIIKKK